MSGEPHGDRPWTAAPVDAAVELDPGLTGGPARPVPGVDNGFVAGYRVRFDEAGPDGHARASTLLRYAQDIAWRHSEDRGFDRSWYSEQARWWVVRAVDLELFTPVVMGRTIRLATAVVGHRRIWARRLGEARLADGRLAASVRTDWVILDERNRLVRIPEAFDHAFPNPEIEGESLRVSLPEAPSSAARHAFQVRPFELDPMAHVNNAVYLDWVEEALTVAGADHLADRLPRRCRIEYAASAGPGDEVEATAWSEGDRWWVRLVRASDQAELVRASGEPLAS